MPPFGVISQIAYREIGHRVAGEVVQDTNYVIMFPCDANGRVHA